MKARSALPCAAAAILAAALGGCGYQGAGDGSGGAGSSSVAVQVGPDRLGHPAVAGRTYMLQPVAVRNRGTAAVTVTAVVQWLSPGPGHHVPPGWVRCTGTLTLAPGGFGHLRLRLTVPAGAKPGRYRSDVLVTAAGTGAASAAGVGAGLGSAAATLLLFRVVAP